MDDLGQAQERLGRALDRARAGEDRVLAAVVREEGERLVKLLNGVLAMARLHAPDNHAFDQPMRDLEGALGRLVALLGAVHLLAVEDQVYVNDIRIRLEGSEAAQDLGGRLRRHNVGGVSFHAPLGEAQLRLLVGAVAASPDPDRPRPALQAALGAQGLDSVELVGIHRFRVSGEKEPAQVRDARAVAASAGSLVDEAQENLAAGRMPNPLPLRRVVIEILEAGVGADALWDDPDGATPYAAHTVRVCQLALLLGRALGLPEGALQDLGVAAMFHDVGYAAREGATARDGRTEGGYPPPFARHSTAGARLLLETAGLPRGQGAARAGDARSPPPLRRPARKAVALRTAARDRGGLRHPGPATGRRTVSRRRARSTCSQEPARSTTRCSCSCSRTRSAASLPGRCSRSPTAGRRASFPRAQPRDVRDAARPRRAPRRRVAPRGADDRRPRAAAGAACDADAEPDAAAGRAAAGTRGGSGARRRSRPPAAARTTAEGPQPEPLRSVAVEAGLPPRRRRREKPRPSRTGRSCRTSPTPEGRTPTPGAAPAGVPERGATTALPRRPAAAPARHLRGQAQRLPHPHPRPRAGAACASGTGRSCTGAARARGADGRSRGAAGAAHRRGPRARERHRPPRERAARRGALRPRPADDGGAQGAGRPPRPAGAGEGAAVDEGLLPVRADRRGADLVRAMP